MMESDSILIASNDHYILVVDLQKNRAYLTLLGYWKSLSDVSGFIDDIRTGVQELSYGFTMLADMTSYDGTSSGLHHLHFEAQKIAVAAGVSRVAEIFNKNPILKSFADMYSKESGAITMPFLEKLHAERWLDLY
jgi:hypothetical protein